MSEASPRPCPSSLQRGGSLPHRSRGAHCSPAASCLKVLLLPAPLHPCPRPPQGDALLFFSANPDQTEDAHSMHAGCPVIKGALAASQRWLRGCRCACSSPGAGPACRWPRPGAGPEAGARAAAELGQGPASSLPCGCAGVKWTGTKWFHQKPFRPATFVAPRAGEALHDPGVCRDDDSRCPQWKAEGQCESNAAYMVGGPRGACLWRLPLLPPRPHRAALRRLPPARPPGRRARRPGRPPQQRAGCLPPAAGHSACSWRAPPTGALAACPTA
jgi:hypothetical protein